MFSLQVRKPPAWLHGAGTSAFSGIQGCRAKGLMAKLNCIGRVSMGPYLPKAHTSSIWAEVVRLW